MNLRFPLPHARLTLAALFLAVAILGVSLPWAFTTVVLGSTPAVVAADTFERTPPSGWGSADTGGAYALFNGPTGYSVAGGSGLMTLPAAQRTQRALLPNVSLRDVDLTVRVATDRLPVAHAGGAGQFAYVIARHQQIKGAEFRGYARFDPQGRVFLYVTYSNSGEDAGEYGLAGPEVLVPGLTHTANQFFWLRMQAVGALPTTIRLKTWQDGTTEPADWQLTVTDSHIGDIPQSIMQHAGSVGLQSYVSLPAANAPVTFSFDDLQVTDLAP